MFASSEWPGTTLADLEHGRSLYANHCSGCHSLYHPASQPAPAWPQMVHEMGSRAKLSDNEQDLVVRYLVSTR